MAGSPQLVVKIVGNTEELIKNLNAGRGAIELYGPTVAKMQDTWARHSASIVEKAALVTASMKGIGVSTLTAADAASNLKVLEAGMAHLVREGKAIPPLMQQTADSLKGAGAATSSWSSALGSVNGLLGAFGLAMSAAAVVRFVGSVFDAASNIHDMSLKLGISAEAVQGFKFAAEQAGSSLDAVGTAITRMNVNLSEGDKGTVAALTKAGLQFAAIRAMKPEDAFLAITDAIATIPDPMTRSEVALQLFGKSAAELLPAIAEGFRRAADGANKMSDETIKSLEQAQDAWSKLGTGVTIASGTVIAKLIDLGEWYGRVSDSWSTGLPMAAKAAEKAIEVLPPVLVKTAEALKAVDTAATDVAKKSVPAAMTALEKMYTDVAKADRDFANARGMAQMKDGEAALARAAENITAEARMKQDAVGLELAAIDAAAQAEIAAQAAVDAALKQTVAVIGEMAPAYAAVAVAATSAASDAEMSWSQAMGAASKGMGTMTGTVQAPQTQSQMQKAAKDAGGSVAYDDYDNPYIHIAGVNNPGKSTPGQWLSGWRASGGPVSAGESYMVGERGPELFRPGSAGTIIPNGGGGGSVVVHIDARESFFDTPASLQRLASKVSAAIVAEQRSYGRVAG